MLHFKQTKPPPNGPEGSERPFWQKKWSWWATSLLLALVPWLLSAASVANAQDQAAADTRPNIVLLVADDAGYSDFEPFGGDVKTPTIDAFAAGGVKFTNFHTMPTCSPSRSIMLTGVVNHLNGVGTMAGNLTHNPLDAQTDQPGYLSYFNDHVVTVATLLKDSGYHTYHLGKWHLAQEGEAEGQDIFERGSWPIDKGFEKSYGMLDGGGEHYGSCERAEGGCTAFVEGDQIITGHLPTDYFSAAAHTDKAIEYIDAGRTADAGQRKPFFIYFADTLPHEPLQVPAEYISPTLESMYYTKGWDGIRQDRFQRMIAAGLIPTTTVFLGHNKTLPDWNTITDTRWITYMTSLKVNVAPYNTIWGLPTGTPTAATIDQFKHILARKFAVYTGMISYFDNQVGRIVQHLKDIGEYNNTVFIFVSDNGGDAVDWDFTDLNFMLRRGINNTYDNVGLRGSFVSNGLGWAQVANTPLDGGKVTMYEGGIRVPLIIAAPGGQATTTSGALAGGADIGATILDYANVTHPVGTGAVPSWANCTGSYHGQTGICPMNGKSLRSIVEGKAAKVHDGEAMAFELFGNANKAMLVEDGTNLWKIRKVGDFGFGRALNEPWKLFNLATDLAESTDLSASNPDKLKELITRYNSYEFNVGFIATRALAVKGVKPSSTVTYTFAITNTSPFTDSFTFACQSNWQCTISQATPGSITIPAGKATTIRAFVNVPANAAPGASNTAQINVLRSIKPAFDRNFTAVTVVAGTPLPNHIFLPIVEQSKSAVGAARRSSAELSDEELDRRAMLDR